MRSTTSATMNPHQQEAPLNTNQPQNQSRPNLSLFALILLILIVFISVAELRQAYGFLDVLQNERDAYIEAHIRTDYDAWNEIVRYARNLNRFFIHHRGFDGIAHPGAVTSDDVAEDVASLTSRLTFELVEALTRFMNSVHYEGQGPGEAWGAQAELINELAELAPLYIRSIDDRWQISLSYRVSNFAAIQNYLEATEEFVFILHDGVLDQTFYNVETDDFDVFLREEVYAIIDLSDIFTTFNGIPLNESFARGSISGLIALPMEQPSGSVISLAAQRAHTSWLNSIESARGVTYAYIGLALGATLITLIVILKSLLPNTHGAWGGIIFGSELYAKLPLLFKSLFAIYAIAFIARVTWSPFAQTLGFNHLIATYLAVIVILFSVILIVYTLRGKHQFSDELEVRIAKKIILGFGIIRSLSPIFLPIIWAGLVLVSIGSLLAGLYFLYVVSIAPNSGSVLSLLLCIGFLITSAASSVMLLVFITYAESYYYIKIIAEGHPVTIPEQRGLFGKPLNAISGLSHGLQSSLEEQLQAERTKTELITSVSHDLKTPLTSIINYVTLLKNSNIENDTAREYVEILENKSERLKILIEDLFEAAKLTSGSMELNLMPVDIAQLLTQAVGELSDKFESSNIDIRYTPPEDKFIIMLDGQRMWRVFENLLNNIANYSPPGSRAYITIEQLDQEVEIVMKNVSLYPLDIDPNELFERFKRGDTARTTEGSGLGLSIAKDIVELHDGRVQIAIDGDLFKVTIGLELAHSQY